MAEVIDLEERKRRLTERIEAALERIGAEPQSVALVAVTKKHSTATLRAALQIGLREIGENYVLEAVEKQKTVGVTPAHWHLLGHLQSNKVQAAVQTFDLIQSVDSDRLARLIGRQAHAVGKRQGILLQVHLGDEETKFGLPPETVTSMAQEIAETPGLTLRGLMGIAPQGEDPRPYFRQLRTLYEMLPSPQRIILSMGMTNDFEAAVEEGSTMVRIGTALFGQRSA